ncbi:MAG: hypothetical protein RL033_3916, partial [Pseudomonadota bacterium]
RYCHENQLQTARLLGMSRNVVRARLIQYGQLHGTLRGPSAERRPSEPPPSADGEGEDEAPASSRSPTRSGARLAG